MKKYRNLYRALLLVLMLSLTFGSHALAERTFPATVANGESDCGCSDSGSSAYGSGMSGWSAGYGTSADDAAASTQGKEQPSLAESASSANLIWVNLISVCVVAATAVMLIRHRNSGKRKQSADQSKDAPGGFGRLPDTSKDRPQNFCEETFLTSAGQVYVQLQQALSSGAIAPLEPLLGSELCRRLKQAVDSDSGEKEMGPFGNAEIRDSRIVRFARENGADVLSVRIHARIIEDGVRSKTGEAATTPGKGDVFVISICTFKRAEGETNWKLTQIRREQKVSTWSGKSVTA